MHGLEGKYIQEKCPPPPPDENPRLVGVEQTCPASPRTEILHSASGVHRKKESEQRGSSKTRLRLSSANLRFPSVPTSQNCTDLLMGKFGSMNAGRERGGV